MKKISRVVAILALTGISLTAAADDSVIMTVNGKPVLRSEFVYSYNKNNSEDVIERKTVKEYVTLFANYKRKVEAALDAHLDTLSSYQKEFRQYRDQQVLPTLVNDADIEKEALNIYSQTKENIGPDGLVNPQHILLRVGQNDDQAIADKQKLRADSIYQALTNGADFDALAKQLSQDPGSAPNGGDIGWVQHGMLLENFDKTIFAMQAGEISKPFLTEVGYHIVKIKARKQLEPYDTLRNDIYSYIERRNLRKTIAEQRLKGIAEEKGIDQQTVMDMRADSISAISQDMKYLIQEYHDGLLLYEISNREVWDKVAKDEKGLEAFFKKNKKNYKWDKPRFKGIAYYTRSKDDIEAVKKSVKGKPFNEWAQILRTTFNKDSVLRIRVEKGIFKRGVNGLVDRNIFGATKAKVKEIKDFPNNATYGKLLEAPEEMSDVRALVVADYQEQKETEWVKNLEKRYPVVVNEEVLATVEEKLISATK